ncbi:MAG: enolase C-terminal domain-like protein [Myxococcaceae bacterium]
MRPEYMLTRVTAAAYRVPTETPESDGTFSWDSTTLVTVHAWAGGKVGFGYSYGSAAMATVVDGLSPRLVGLDALAVEDAWQLMSRAVRNFGREGIAAGAISAIDVALWDLKAKLLDVSLQRLLGQVRDSVEVYGSGGFTNYDARQLGDQIEGWRRLGLRRMKLKVGTDAGHDPGRVRQARREAGDRVALMVDANGAWSPARALELAAAFAEQKVEWFEEPVSSDDLEGLREVREKAPPGVQIAAGEYGYTPHYFRRMLEARAVDVLQADATRCLGITGFLGAARLCEAFHLPLSAHCAPSLHARLGCAVTPLVHVEYFHDHQRIESQLFDGFTAPRDGRITPDAARPGLGFELKEGDAECHRIR